MHHHKQKPPAARGRKFMQNFDAMKKKCKSHIVPLRCSEIYINFDNNSTITTL